MKNWIFILLSILSFQACVDQDFDAHVTMWAALHVYFEGCEFFNSFLGK